MDLLFLMVLGVLNLNLIIYEIIELFNVIEEKSYGFNLFFCSLVFSLFVMSFLFIVIRIAKLEFLGG